VIADFGLKRAGKKKLIYWTQMNADFKDFKHKELTEKIIKTFVTL
jgi:hypothetical protein